VNKLGRNETSKTKGHNCVSLFVDFAEKRTIFALESKGSETMTAFAQDFKEHYGNPGDITDVSMDMSLASFINRVEENLHNAKLLSKKTYPSIYMRRLAPHITILKQQTSFFTTSLKIQTVLKEVPMTNSDWKIKNVTGHPKQATQGRVKTGH
jgi:Transposase